MPDANTQPNQWGVTLAVSDEQILDDLLDWTWGECRDPVPVAQTVFSVIREQTMACLDDNGETVVVGLCEFAIPLHLSLTELLDEWIEVRAGRQTGTIDVDQDRIVAAGLIQRLNATVAKLRAALEPAALEPQDADNAA
jgi:hypothetical protein